MGDEIYKKINLIGESNHVFRHAFFSKDNGPLPPREVGCYVLLSENLIKDHGVGTHTVLYVGSSKDLCDRMHGHSTETDYSERYRIIKRWPFNVLFALKSEMTRESSINKYEELLHYLFVPVASFEFERAVYGGLKWGRSDQVKVSLEDGVLEWCAD